MSSSNINEKVQEALQEGHSWEDIQSHLNTLNNPEAKSYLAGLKAASAPEQQQTVPAQSGMKTGLLDYIEQNPADAAMYGAGAYALLQAPKIASKVADYRLKQRELGLKERSLNAYEAQVAKQGVSATPAPLNPQDDLIQSVRQNEFEQQKATQPTAKELRDQIALQREQLKLEQDKLKHENFVRQNTWSPEEIALGRRIKDPAELAIAQKVMAQKASQAGIAPATAPAPVAPPVTPAPADELSQWLKQAPVTPIEPANVVSTGSTPEAAAAPIEKAAEVKKAVEPPPTGMKAQYTKKKGEMGPGGYNWFASQVGHEEAPARWEEQYGKRNVPYEQVQQEYQATRYPPTPKTVEGKSGGAFGKPDYIPEHIRGSSNLKGLAGLVGTAGLLMAVTTPEAKAAMARASESIKDIGISPEAILRGKGDELGRMGNAYVNAGNPNYLRELKSQIDVETDPERRKILLQEFQKIGGSGAGRGIAPPSAYMR